MDSNGPYGDGGGRNRKTGGVMEVLDGPYGGGEGDAIDETADVPAVGGLYDSLLITAQ